MSSPSVLIVMGSKSDLPIMEESAKILSEFGVSYKMTVASAHRTPEKAAVIAKGAKSAGVKVIIAGAGFAAHLAGALAAQTILPVIGVPLEGSALKGIDALLSTVQMPGGIPVAAMTIGKAGAKNAGIFASEIMALSDSVLAKKLAEYRKKMAESVEKDDATIVKAGTFLDL